MKLKKFFLNFCLIIILTTSFQSSFAVEKFDNNAKLLKESIETKIPEFEIWQSGNLIFKDILHDKEGKIMYNLYSIKNINGIIGYMITDLKNSKTIEFALGESPYDSLMDNYIDYKLIKPEIRSSENLKLMYSSVNYGFTIDKFKTLYDLTKEQNISIKANTMKALEMSENIKTIPINTKSSLVHQKIINEVPSFLNTPEYGTACGPTSGLNILGYWDINGYEDLVTVNLEDKYERISVYNKLYTDMESFPVLISSHATLPSKYGPGLEKYFSDMSYEVNVTIDGNITSSDYSNFIINEVNQNRPGTILFGDNNDYGLHYVTLVGYYYEESLEYKYIIHDLWTESNVYKDWDQSINNSDFWKFYKIIPN